MQLRQFTTQKLLPGVKTTPKDWKHDPDLNIKHEDLYEWAWECDYERPIFDTKDDNAAPPNSHEIAVHSDLPNEETWNTPETSGVRSLKCFPHSVDIYDVTDMYSHMEVDAKMISEQQNPTPTNPRSLKNNLCHNPKFFPNDGYRY